MLGEDVTNTAPIMALRIRQSVRQAPMQIAESCAFPHGWTMRCGRRCRSRRGRFYSCALRHAGSTTSRLKPLLLLPTNLRARLCHCTCDR